MKYVERIKFIIALVLISFPILIEILLIFSISTYFDKDFSHIFLTYPNVRVENQISTNTLLFLGICAFSGAYLLASVKSNSKIMKSKEKTPIQESEQIATYPERDSEERLQ